MSKWIRGVAAVLVGMGLVVGGFYATGGRIFVYSTQNEGVVATAPYGCLGLEVKGHPGLFGGLDPMLDAVEERPGVCEILERDGSFSGRTQAT